MTLLPGGQCFGPNNLDGTPHVAIKPPEGSKKYFGWRRDMRNLSVFVASSLLAFFLVGTFTAGDAGARKKRNKPSVVKLRLDEGKRVMKFPGFKSMKVDKPALLKIVHNRRKGTFTWIPKRRGVTFVRYRLKLPYQKRVSKGKLKVIIR